MFGIGLVLNMSNTKSNPNVIVVSGVPGTGKSAIAQKLANKLKGKYLELSKEVIKNKLYIQYDSKSLSYVINENATKNYVKKVAEKTKGLLIVDSHYGEIIDDELIIKIFVLRLNPIILYERLIRRGWPLKKVIENVEAEIVGTCLINALELHPKEKVCDINVTNKDADEVVQMLINQIRKPCTNNYTNWLSNKEIMNFINKLLQVGKSD